MGEGGEGKERRGDGERKENVREGGEGEGQERVERVYTSRSASRESMHQQECTAWLEETGRPSAPSCLTHSCQIRPIQPQHPDIPLLHSLSSLLPLLSLLSAATQLSEVANTAAAASGVAIVAANKALENAEANRATLPRQQQMIQW